MRDHVFESFLRQQYREGMELAAQSDLLDLLAQQGELSQKYIAEFRCRGLVSDGTGEVREDSFFAVGIYFGSDHLRRVEPLQLCTWLHPITVWHPNLRPPVVCVGHVTPGIGIRDILYQLFEIVSWNNITIREDDALNHAACRWARAHPDRYPVDTRPLKRMPRPLEAQSVNIEGGS